LPCYLPLQDRNLGIKINDTLPLRRKGRQEVLQTRGEEQFKEAGSRQLLASSFKTQAQGRKDTPGRSKDSSSFKTQQTGQGRRPKAEFKVHSDLSKKDKYKQFTATRPSKEAKYN
jgi:hypothetical protein